MQKEIHEQPRAVADTLEAVIDGGVDVDGLFGAGAEGRSATRARPHPRLGHQLLRRAWSRATGWRASREVPCNVELGHEYRYRDSIPDAAAARRHHLAVRRDARHDGSPQAREGAGHANTLSICNVRESAIPRASQVRVLHARRRGDRRGLHQGLHHASSPRSSRSRSRSRRRTGRLTPPPRRERHRAAALRAGQHPARAQPRAAGPGLGRALRRARARAVPRPWAALPGGARGRAQAQGNLVHPRRGLSRPGSSSTGRSRWWTPRCPWW